MATKTVPPGASMSAGTIVISEELCDLGSKLEAQLSDLTISARLLADSNQEGSYVAIGVLLDRVDALAACLRNIILEGEAAAESARSLLDGGPAA